MHTSEDDPRYSEILKRLASLESRLAQLEQPRFQVAAPQPDSSVPTSEPLFQAPSFEPIIEEQVTPPSQSRGLESKVGLTLLNRIGVVTLVLGVAFFFKWAADNNWVGPAGRVSLGLLAAFLTLGIADYLWRKGQHVFAQGLSGTGSAVMYVALYAAFDFYHLLPQPLAFVLLLAATGLAIVLARRYQSQAIAALGFVGAYVIPLLLSNGSDKPWFLIFYILAINFAAAQLAARHRWPRLEWLSFSATLLIFGAWILRHGSEAGNRWAATFGLLAFCSQRFFTSRPILFLFTQMLCALGAYLVWPKSEPFSFLALLIAAAGLLFARLRGYSPIQATAFSAFWLTLELWLGQENMPPYLKAVEPLGFLLFYAWTWWRVSASRQALDPPATAVFALNGLCFFGIVYQALNTEHHEWLGLLAVAIAVSYLAVGAYTQRNEEDRSGITPLALAFCALFLTLAILIQFSGFTITIAWAMQAAAFVWIGVRLKSLRTLAAGIAVFLLAFLKALISDARQFHDLAAVPLVGNTRFLTFAVLAAALLCAAYWLQAINRRLALVHFACGHIALLTGLSLEVSGWAQRSTRPAEWLSRETVSVSVLFALYAIVLVGVGVAARSLASRAAGLLLIGIVIVKLYLFDVWQLGRAYQIAAFVILGILLLSTSFLYSRFKEVVGAWRRQG